MDIVAVAVLGFFALGYLVLGGSDIGTGMVLPLLARDSRERRLVVTAIAPFFLGNEVWLVATVGVLAGAFPALESALLHEYFAPFVVLLVGWVVRDTGLWLRGRVDGHRWRASCDTAIVAGSWAVALSWGVIFTDVLVGSSAGPIGALVVAALFGAHGLAFASVRLTGPPRDRVRRLAGPVGEGPLLALTSAGLVVLGLFVGLRLAPASLVADHATLAFLLPPLVLATPVLLAPQAWVWWTFRHRVVKPAYL
ncbi:cytochrome d ubiquinol oxidase subunit II [Umezawaea sp. NPDC059074]|uniref:cytochrome d ubiquinol oxidase subunit II n=1 Tax=Umezawaea sp. NPDC059074 TaxID=3346716 RepID=UPI00367ACF34